MDHNGYEHLCILIVNYQVLYMGKLWSGKIGKFVVSYEQYFTHQISSKNTQ